MDVSFAFWTPILALAGYAAIIAMGQFVSMSSGILSVASGALAGIGAYSAGALTSRLDVPLVLALFVSVVAGFLVGWAIGFLSARLAPLVAGLITLAFAEVMVVTAFNIDALGGAQGLSGVATSVGIPEIYAVLALVVAFVWRYDSSRLGIAARAVRDDPDAAAAVGIPVTRIKSMTFAIGGSIAALGGALQVHYLTVITPDDLGFWVGVNYLLFAVFGGSFVFWGPLVGALLLTILPNALGFPESERYIAYGLLLTIMVVLRPEGLIQRRTAKAKDTDHENPSVARSVP